MATSRPRRLVVNASVASAANRKSASERARRCFGLLLEVKRSGHILIMTDRIRDEWKAKASNQAVKWQRWMASHGKMVFVLEGQLSQLRLTLGALPFSRRERRLMEEDTDLLRAAYCTDRIVFSLDEEVRHLFARASRELGQLRNIMWSNPDRDPDCVSWVSAGAPTDSGRMLSTYGGTP